MPPLKLIALDGEDVPVISAHLQDAVLRTEDIHWRPAEQRVVLGLNRFDWEAVNGEPGSFRRRRAALRFERVRSCKCRDLDCSKSQVVNLLAVEFSENDPPSGVVTLIFSGGGALRLEVECVEAELADLGPVWITEACPAHAVDTRQQG